MKKKIISGLTSAAMLFAGVLMPVESTLSTVMTAYAASSYAGVATAVPLNGTSDEIYCDKAAVATVFSVTTTSAINLGIDIFTNASLAITLYDSNDNSLLTFSAAPTSAGDAKHVLQSISVAAGTYYLRCVTTNAFSSGYQVTFTGNSSRTNIATSSSIKVSGVEKSYVNQGVGVEIKPTPTVKDGTKTLKENTDYTLSYENNKGPSIGSADITAKVIITGIGSYMGEIEIEFTITTPTHTHISDSGTVTTAPTLTSTGVMTYKCRTCGEVIKTETIAKLIDINSASVSIESSYNYTGSAIQPDLTGKVTYGGATLTKGTDYTVAYGTNIEGTGTIVLTGTGLYGGTKTVTFTINKAATPTRLAGDVDGNGVVNMKDLTRLQQYLAAWGVTINESNANVNGDSVINMKDLTRLQQWLAAWDVELE